MTHDRFVDLVGPAFQSMGPSGVLPGRNAVFGTGETLICEKDIEQAHITLGVKGLALTDPRRFALNLLNTILGGNMSSRLFQEIRERRGLAYSVYSFVSSHVDTGMVGTYAAVEPGQVPETISLMVKEMRGLKELPVDEATLRDAKEYTKGSLLLAAESVDNQMARLAQNEFTHGRFMPLEEIIDGIERVTPGDVRELAQELFQPTPGALVVLGPDVDAAGARGAFSL